MAWRHVITAGRPADVILNSTAAAARWGRVEHVWPCRSCSMQQAVGTNRLQLATCARPAWCNSGIAGLCAWDPGFDTLTPHAAIHMFLSALALQHVLAVCVP